MLKRISRLRAYVVAEWRGLSLILLLTALASLVAAVQPWPMKFLIDAGIRHEPLPASVRTWFERTGIVATTLRLIWLASLAQLAIAVMAGVLDLVLGWLWALVGQRMVNRLAVDLFHRLQRLSLRFHMRQHVGDSLARLSGDTWSVYSLTATLLVSPIQQLLTLVAIASVAMSLDRQLATLSLLVAPFVAAASLYFGERLKQRALDSRIAQSRLTSFVQQTLTAMPLVQSCGAQDRNNRQFRNLAGEAVAWAQKAALVNGSYGLVTGLITTAGIAIVMFAGGHRVLSGNLTIGGLLVFAAYTRTLQKAEECLFQTYAAIKPVEAGLDRVFEVLDQPESVADLPAARPLRHHRPSPRGHVRLEEVTFGYQPGEPVLNRVTLEARPGETVAIIGSTGAGKTTIASLIPRFVDPCEGRVTFDGVDIRDIKLASLRDNIAMMPQDPLLFPVSIAENIGYGRSGASLAEIVRAAQEAHADEFIRRLPQGYGTVLGSRGSTLSGGERQRIAIARALLKKSLVLILDEPTSALDTESESLLMDAIERARLGRTVIFIAHRLSTAQRADRVLVIERGHIVESGSPSSLLDAGGTYSRFYAASAGNALAGAAS